MSAVPVFKRDEIILLLGAGASVEVGIPDSSKMIDEIEGLIASNPAWSNYQELYRYVRSSIFFADGLEGIIDDDVPFNIERLVNVLDELQKKERHTLYPFVGAWNPKLQEVAGEGFSHVRGFRDAIVQILRNEWVALRETEAAVYYRGLLRFQKEYEHPLRVFSLNYDLCVEQVCGNDYVQRGFNERTWDWRMFDESSQDYLPLLLYKLHGSLDWYFKDGQVQYSDSPSAIRDNEIALIFGTSYKLTYLDPFLFFMYELRRWTLDAARIIVCIGYGFSDEHINGILGQALRQNCERKLIAVTGPGNDVSTRMNIVKRLDVEDRQVLVYPSKASEFLDRDLTISALAGHFPIDNSLIREIRETTDGSDSVSRG